MILSIKSALEGIRPDEKLISDTEQMLRNAQSGKNRARRLGGFGMAACFALIMATAVFAGYTVYRTPVSYVSIDINPSLELGVNRFDRVVAVWFYNEEAEKLMDKARLQGQTPGEALNLIYSAAEGGGYIAEDGSTVISIAASGKNEGESGRLLEECTAAVNEKAADVISDTVSKELKTEAASMEISAGKLKLIKMVQALDDSATVEEFKDSSVTDIVGDITRMTSRDYAGASPKAKDVVQNEMNHLRQRWNVAAESDTSETAESNNKDPKGWKNAWSESDNNVRAFYEKNRAWSWKKNQTNAEEKDDKGKETNQSTGFGWGKETDQSTGFGWGKETDKSAGFGWGKETDKSAGFDWGKETDKSTGFGWGKETDQSTGFGWGKGNDKSTGFGQDKETDKSTGFGQSKETDKSTGFGWGKENDKSTGFGQDKENDKSTGFGWGKENDKSTGFGQDKETDKSTGFGQSKETDKSTGFGQGDQGRETEKVTEDKDRNSGNSGKTRGTSRNGGWSFGGGKR